MKAGNDKEKEILWLEKYLTWFAGDIPDYFIPKCHDCGKIATKQTAKGKGHQEALHRPCDWGWYCKKCYAQGLEREHEAMYG